MLKLISGLLLFSFSAFSQTPNPGQVASENFRDCMQQGMALAAQTCEMYPLAQGQFPTSVRFSVIPGDNTYVDYGIIIFCAAIVPPGVYDGPSPSRLCLHDKAATAFPPTSFTNRSIDAGSIPRDPVCRKGSVIYLDSRSVGESLPISGSEFSLNYQTHFDPARTAGKTIDLEFGFSGDYQVPRSIILSGPNFRTKRIEYPALGAISVNYVMQSSDLIVPNPFIDSSTVKAEFAAGFNSSDYFNGTLAVGVQGDNEIYSKSFKLSSYKPKVWGFGGWTLSNHHYYDPDSKVLYLGNGLIRNVEGIQKGVESYGLVWMIATKDASEVYLFDTYGRHLETRTGLMGSVKYQFRYDAESKVTQIIDGNGLRTDVTRSGNYVEFRNHFGVVTAIEVNSAGKLAKLTQASGLSTEVLYEQGSGLLSSIRYPTGLVTTFTHTERGLFVREDKNTGGFQVLTETIQGLIKYLQFTTAENVVQKNTDDKSGPNIKRYEYDSENNIVNGTQESLDGSVVSTERPKFNSYQRFQDDPRFGKQVRVPAEQQTFFPNGFAAGITSSYQLSYQNNDLQPFGINELSQRDQISMIGYSPIIRETKFNGSEGSLTFTEDNKQKSKLFLDSKERIARVQSEGLLDVKIDYNNLGQVAQTSQGKSKVQFGYNPSGFLSEETEAGRTTRYQRDQDGKLTIKTLPNGDQIQFSYGANGLVEEIRTPNNQIHRFQNSLLGFVTQYLPPVFSSEVGNTVNTYDSDGRIRMVTKPGRGTATFFYKAGTNFLERISTPDGDYRFENIDSLGRAQLIISPDGIRNELQFIEDKTVMDYWSDPSLNLGRVIQYDLDGLFRAKFISVAGAVSVPVTYDFAGRVTRAGDETYSYSFSNAVVGDYPQASQTVVSQLGSNLSTVSSIVSSENPSLPATQRKIAMEIRNLTGGGTLHVETQEIVDASGNIEISAMTDRDLKNGSDNSTSVSQFHTYDLNSRLAQIEESEQRQLNGQVTNVPRRVVANYGFGQNSNNNIQSYEHFGKLTTATYGAQDRLLKLSGAIERDFEYYPDGSLSKISNCLGEKKFEYDFFGNLKRVTLPGNKVISYKVDGLNRRSIKLLNGVVVERYTWYDQTRLAMVENERGSIAYVYGAHPIAPSYLVFNGAKYKVIPTWKGDIRFVVAEDGAVVQELQYDEYGNVMKDTSLGRTESGQVIRTPFQPLGFASGLTDFDTKMIRFGARDYDPVVGRWTAKDPIGFAGGDTNLYSYVGQNPLNLVDTNGEAAVAPALFLGAVITAVPATFLLRDYFASQSNPLIQLSKEVERGQQIDSGGQCPVRNGRPAQPDVFQINPRTGLPDIPRSPRGAGAS